MLNVLCTCHGVHIKAFASKQTRYHIQHAHNMQFYTPDKPMSVCKKVTRVGKSGNAMKGGEKKGGEGGLKIPIPRRTKGYRCKIDR